MSLIDSTQRQPAGPSVAVGCEWCGKPIPPKSHPGGQPKRFCSEDCRRNANKRRTVAAKRQRQPAGPSVAVARKRRPLPDAAGDAAWALRKDVDRIKRIFADDRFGAYEQQVAPLLRSHLLYAAEVCQDLLSRINHQTGD